MFQFGASGDARRKYRETVPNLFRVPTRLKRMQESPPQINPHLERPPAIDAAECLLTAPFLRRYVTYCARRHRYAQMQGAGRLYGEIVATMNALA